MQDLGIDSFKIFEGELKEQELHALRILVRDGIDEESDAQFLFLLLDKSLDNFAPRY